jgi:hypothetical protein
VRCSREKARASILGRTLRAGHEVFRAHLVPLRVDAGERFAPVRRAGLDAGLADAAAAL